MILILTVDQFCERFDLAKSTVYKNFYRIQTALAKKNIKVHKMKDNNITMYVVEQEYTNKDLPVFYTDFKSLQQFDDLKFNILLTLSSLENSAYCGKVSQLLEEKMGLKVTDRTCGNLITAVAELEKEGYLLTNTKELQKGYILLGLSSKMAQELSFRRSLIEMCKELSKEKGKKSYIPLFKVIVALTMLSKKETITYTQITGMTGLSSYQIKEQLQILDEKNKIKIGRLQYEVSENYIRCIGRPIDINAFEVRPAEEIKRVPREENIENKNAGIISEKPNIVIFKK